MNTHSEFLCNTDELSALLGDDHIRIIDSSWYLPTQNVDARADYEKKHIPGAVFFDIDAISDQNRDLPHMLPTPEQFAQAVGELGISNNHDVIVYDSAGLFSAARVWWMFHVFGHQRVRVLNGGLPAWREAGGELTGAVSSVSKEHFEASLNNHLVADKALLQRNSAKPEFTVMDARSNARFIGAAPEPRPGLPSGHMPNSISLPFDQLLDNGMLRPADELRTIFQSLDTDGASPIITTCGSGVTAAIITLALAEAGFGLQQLYDGAWAEWASADDTVVITG